METIPNVTLAVGGAPWFNFRWQCAVFQFLYKTELVIFFELARSKFDLTLKVFITNHYIENKQKNEKRVHPMAYTNPPNVTNDPPNVISLVGSKKGRTETANALI
jgi:hypothetical protein